MNNQGRDGGVKRKAQEEDPIGEKLESSEQKRNKAHPGIPASPIRGKSFADGINRLKSGEISSIFTEFALPIQMRNSKKKHPNLEVAASFHTNTHFNKPNADATVGRKIWTQGMLERSQGSTTYFNSKASKNRLAGKVVPTDLSLNRATLESRAIKAMLDTSYQAKISRINKEKDMNLAGGVAIGSFLEDVTAKRGLGFENVGSAMRAELMAAKWKMKVSGNTASSKFGGDLLNNFPQLGNQKMPEKYGQGASDLWDKIHAGEGESSTKKSRRERSAVLNKHLGNSGSIYKAHMKAYGAAENMFEFKWNKPEERENDKWWKEHSKELKSAKKNPDLKEQLKTQYVKRKLERHGIVQGHEAQSIDAYKLPGSPEGLRGAGFLEGINNLSKRGDKDAPEVFAKLDVPFMVGEEKKRMDAAGTFSIVTRRNEDKRLWTQGILEPSGNTAYFEEDKSPKIMPGDLSWNRALAESRAMKYLSTADYDAAAKMRSGYNQKGDLAFEHWGKLAMGSFIEDVTGARALGIADTGSALRAKIMDAKWSMANGDQGKKTSKNVVAKGFGEKVMEALPQLGKSGWKQRDTAENFAYGASALNEQFAADKAWHGKYGVSVKQAHMDAWNTASQRFDKKWANPIQQGEWWKKQGDLSKANPEDLRAKYIEQKFQKHGISNSYNAEAAKQAKEKGEKRNK